MVAEIIRIPEERKAVLIGPSGETKDELESVTGTRITVSDSVQVEGDDPERVYTVREIIKAIARGFSPEDAMNLLDDNWHLHVISLVGEKANTIKRLMGRVIGKRGATRHIIEEATGCKISVYGKTASIIGPWDGVEKARGAVEQLLEGRSHGYVYRRLMAKV